MPRVRGFIPRQLSPLSFPPAAFFCDKANIWIIDSNYITLADFRNDEVYLAPVIAPNGITITKLTLFGCRTSAVSILELTLQRGTRTGVTVAMATVTADWTSGDSSAYDDSIVNPIIDNETYNYVLQIRIAPELVEEDAKFAGALIEFAG